MPKYFVLLRLRRSNSQFIFEIMLFFLVLRPLNNTYMLLMKKLFLLLLLLPSFLMAQEKIGNKIYKYGDVYHSVQGATAISFNEAQAKTMSKTLEYFSKAGANVKSLNSIILPGSEVSEYSFTNTLNSNNIETLILIDVINSSNATMNRTTSNAYSSVNSSVKSSANASGNRTSTSSGGVSTSQATAVANSQTKAKSTAVSSSVQTSKTSDYVTEMSLRMTIFSKSDGFSKPVAVVEGRATNGSPETTADQIARRIVKRMAKSLKEQNAF